MKRNIKKVLAICSVMILVSCNNSNDIKDKEFKRDFFIIVSEELLRA